MVNTLTGRPREFDEEQVLTSAMEAFWRKGYEATPLVGLTECTCMNKASLHRYKEIDMN